MQDLLHPVSHRVGTDSPSTSARIFDLYLGSGSYSGSSAVAAVSSDGGWSSLTPRASDLPTEGGP